MRKSRKRTLNAHSFLTPINIRDFGNPDKDPCFGKLYDLTHSECQACGDSEFCSIIFNKTNGVRRLVEEKKGNRLDLDFSETQDLHEVKKLVEKFKEEGFSIVKAMKKAATKTNSSYIKIREIINP